MTDYTKPVKRGRPEVDKTAAPKISAADFIAWQQAIGYSDAMAARQLGASSSSIVRYRAKGGSATLGLACAALAIGAGTWTNGTKFKFRQLAQLRRALNDIE